MTKKDIFIGFIIGLVIGVLLIPTLSNINLLSKLQTLLGGSQVAAGIFLMAFFSIGAALGVIVAGFIGRSVPVIWQIAKFGLVGVLNTAVNFAVLNILIAATGIDMGNGFAVLTGIAFVVAVTNSFFWNEHWVFAGRQDNQARQFLTFFIVSLVALGGVALIGKFMTQYIAPPASLDSKQWANVAAVVGVVFSLVWNYLGYKFIVFRKKA